jgi:hypothetical protein
MKLQPERTKAKSLIEYHLRNLDEVLGLMRERLSAAEKLAKVEQARSHVEIQRVVRDVQGQSHRLSRVWEIINSPGERPWR